MKTHDFVIPDENIPGKWEAIGKKRIKTLKVLFLFALCYCPSLICMV